MSRRAIFWGTFLLSIGSSILLIRYNLLPSSWEIIRNFWAVGLILVGIHIMLRDTAAGISVRIVLALILGYTVASCMSDGCQFNWHSNTVHFQWHDESASDDDNDDDEDQANTQGTVQDSTGHGSDTTHRAQQGQQKIDSSKKQTPVY